MSAPKNYARMAQWRQQEFCKLSIGGSNPSPSSSFKCVWPNPNGAGRVCGTRFRWFDSIRSLQKFMKNEHEKPLTQEEMKQAAKARSLNYEELSPQQQWEEDKELGILDWDGK